MTDLRDTAVVLLHFGHPEVTEAALETLRRVYPNPRVPHVVVVENGSLPLALEKFPGITRVSLPENLGYGGGNNHGLRAALSEGAQFIILMNNDVRIAGGAFEAMRRAAEHPGMGVVGLPLQESEGVVWGGGRVSWWTLRACLRREPGPPNSLHYIHGACVGLTRACIERVGLLREDLFLYWEDVEYGFRARRNGFSLAVADIPPLATHTSRPSHRDADDRKTYYLVRNAIYVLNEYGTVPVRWWGRMLQPLRRWVANARGKRNVVRALTDARRGVVGPVPSDR